jgi:hypothetical protein
VGQIISFISSLLLLFFCFLFPSQTDQLIISGAAKYNQENAHGIIGPRPRAKSFKG